MLVFNICILYPLAYKKKKANLETLSRSFDSILDKYLRLIPFLNKKMVAVSEFKKQQWLSMYILNFNTSQPFLIIKIRLASNCFSPIELIRGFDEELIKIIETWDSLL